MPFTISHAAAVLPLHRWSKSRLPLAALMIGSMSPDFIYFLPGDLRETPTHNLAGLFWFCLPVGLAVWFLYVRVLERPTIALLPESWRGRITPSTRELTLAALAVTAAAIILGAVTHIVWDSFTHRSSPVVDVFPELRTIVMRIHGAPIRVYKLLQHLSSLAGFAILVIWAVRAVRAPTPAPASLPPQQSPFLITNRTRLGALAVLFAVSGAFAITSYLLYPGLWIERRLFHFAIGGMTGWVLAWLAITITITRRSMVQRGSASLR